MSAAFVLAACDPSSGEGESSPLDALPQGTDLDPDGGKADGQPQFAFASAQTVSNLAYPEPDEPGEQTWSDDELVEIFRDRVTPASPAESPWNLARQGRASGVLRTARSLWPARLVRARRQQHLEPLDDHLGGSALGRLCICT